MTYEQLCKEFLFDQEKTVFQYKNKNYMIRLVKIPVNEHVEALYMSHEFAGREGKYYFSADTDMEFAGYIVDHTEFKLPSFSFGHYAAETIDKEERGILSQIAEDITRCAVEMVKGAPLPELTDIARNKAEREGHRLFFYEVSETTLPEFISKEHITDDILIDALAGVPGWKEEATKKLMEETAEYSYSNITRKERFLNSLAVIKEASVVAKACEDDKDGVLYHRREMKRAIGDAKTVIIDFVSKENTMETTKVAATAFTSLNEGRPDSISIYNISPEKERERVRALLWEKYSSDLPIERINAIRYGKKTLWQKGN